MLIAAESRGQFYKTGSLKNVQVIRLKDIIDELDLLVPSHITSTPASINQEPSLQTSVYSLRGWQILEQSGRF